MEWSKEGEGGNQGQTIPVWEGMILGGCRDIVAIEVNSLLKCPTSIIVTYWVSPWPKVPFEITFVAT